MATRQQLIDGARQAATQGDTDLARELAQRAQAMPAEPAEPAGEVSPLQAGLMTAGQGLTFGFSDEIAAGLRAGLDSIAEGKLTGISDRYNEALASNRYWQDQARTQHPGLTGTTEFIGGMAAPGGVAAKLGKGAKGVASMLGRTGAAGAGFGGLTGYGYNEGEDVLADIGTGVAAGGAGGAALPLVPLGIGAGARAIKNRFGSGRQAKVDETARRAVAEAVENDIAAGETTLEEARAMLERNPDAVIGDIGPNTRMFTENVAQQPTPASTQLRRQLERRNEEQHRRLMPQLAEELGTKQDDFAAARNQLLQGMRTRADELYGMADDVPIRITPRMTQIMSRVPKARKMGKDLHRLEERPGKFPGKVEGTQPTAVLDSVLRGMDSQVSKLYKAGLGNQASATKKLRDEFRELLYQQNPQLRKARDVWAGDKANNDAMDFGLKLFNEDADVSADIVKGMTEAERVYFRVGAMRALERKLGNKADSADLIKGVLNSPNKRAAVRVAFKNDANFNRFMQHVSDEQKMFDTYKDAATGSQTARRLMGQGQWVEKLAGLAGYTASLSSGVSVPPSMAGHAASKAIRLTGLPQMAARSAANKATAQASQLAGRDLNALMASPPATVRGLMSPAAIGASLAGGGTTGLLAP